MSKKVVVVKRSERKIQETTKEENKVGMNDVPINIVPQISFGHTKSDPSKQITPKVEKKLVAPSSATPQFSFGTKSESVQPSRPKKKLFEVEKSEKGEEKKRQAPSEPTVVKKEVQVQPKQRKKLFVANQEGRNGKKEEKKEKKLSAPKNSFEPKKKEEGLEVEQPVRQAKKLFDLNQLQSKNEKKEEIILEQKKEEKGEDKKVESEPEVNVVPQMANVQRKIPNIQKGECIEEQEKVTEQLRKPEETRKQEKKQKLASKVNRLVLRKIPPNVTMEIFQEALSNDVSKSDNYYFVPGVSKKNKMRFGIAYINFPVLKDAEAFVQLLQKQKLWKDENGQFVDNHVLFAPIQKAIRPTPMDELEGTIEQGEKFEIEFFGFFFFKR